MVVTLYGIFFIDSFDGHNLHETIFLVMWAQLVVKKKLKIENHWVTITNAQQNVFGTFILQLFKFWEIKFETFKHCFAEQINVPQRSVKY